MRFERANVNDKQEILALYAACRSCPGCTWTEDYPGEFQFETDMRCRALYVLRQDGRIIAAASCGFPDDISHFVLWSDVRRPCELARVAVHPQAQGKGIGSVLLKMTVAVMFGKGHDAVHLLVSPGNPAARRLYLKNGFRYKGFAKRYGQNWLCMERK